MRFLKNKKQQQQQQQQQQQVDDEITHNYQKTIPD
jgi:hypothetical protein